MDKLLQESPGGLQLMREELGLGHEQGMEAIDGLQLKMEILILLHSRF